MNPSRNWRRRLLGAALIAATAGAARAQVVVAVLGSEQRPYREAYESMQTAYGQAVPLVALGEALPAATKIVVTFGGKAAVNSYPGNVTLVYAIAPGLTIDAKIHAGPTFKVMMEPAEIPLLRALKEVQPQMKRIAVLWLSGSLASCVERLMKQGPLSGVAVSSVRIKETDDLPNALRDLKGRVDAIWLAPDPLLISAGNFELIKHFSYDNNIPFYAPTDGLAEQGATAAVFVSYAEMGRTTAAAVKKVVGGADPPREVFSEKMQLSINRSAAAQANLILSAEAVKSADKVYP